MEQPTRKTIFALAAAKLRSDFEELKNIPHAGSRGHEGEGILRRFLNNHLPKRFAAGSGFIIDTNNQVSKQTDLIIYDAFNCPIYRVSEDASIFPNDNVAAIIEVKSNLTKEKLEEAAENIAVAKRLAKTSPPELPIPVLINFETLGFVFAFESSLTLDKIVEHYKEIIVKQKELGFHIDFIFVLDKGMLSLAARTSGTKEWNIAFIQGPGGALAEGSHLAVSSHQLGKDTLDVFLRTLLAYLPFFRGMIDHPGFNWSEIESGGVTRLTYLTSITFESDPNKKKEKLEQYRQEVKKDFENPL